MASKVLSRDADWGAFEGRSCEVMSFTPYAEVEGGTVRSTDRTMPYALITLECRERGARLPPDTVGAVRHKVDFKHLWTAFVERGARDDEKVIIIWSEGHLKAAARLFSPFMPKLAVMIFKAEAYELFLDPDYRPELGGRARFVASHPIYLWQPTVWKERIVPTLYEHYVSQYLDTGDEKYLSLIEAYDAQH